MSTRKFYDDPFTLVHTAITDGTRPVTFDVEDITDLDGSELVADFDIRIDGELLKVTNVVLDGGGAGFDRWTASHAGGVAAGAHKVGAQVDVVLTKNGLTVGLLDYFVGAPATPAEGDLLYYHTGAWTRLVIGANNAVLTSNGTDPSWVVPTDDDTAYMPLAGGTFTGDVEFEGQIITSDEGSGSDGQVLKKVSGVPKWAAEAGGMTNPMTTEGDIIYSSDGSGTPARLALGTNEYVLTVDTATSLPKWKVSAAGTALSGLSDVDVSAGLDDGDVLTYNAGAGKWKNADPSGGGGGGILARVSYNPNPGTDYTTTSTSYVAADSTNLSVTFTAPASGNVMIRLSAEGWGINNEVTMIWGVGPHGGAVDATTEGGISSSGSSVSRTRSDLDCYITGLTPSSSYTYDWFLAASFAGFTVGFGAGVRGSEGPSPATMAVWSA